MVVINLISYRSTATTNFVMLIPVLFLIFRGWDERWKKKGRLAIWSSLILFGIGLWWLFIVTLRGASLESPIMFLPFPFFSLIGLLSVRQSTIREEYALVN